MTASNSRVLARKPKKEWSLFFLVLPLVLLVVAFCYVPLFGWGLSLIEYKPGTPFFQNEFVGFKYFKAIFTSRDIKRVFGNTLTFSLINFCLLPMPMLFAILLNEINSTPFKKIAQTITTLPHFISWVIVYALAFAIFSTDGMLNTVLDMMGLEPQSLLTNKKAVYAFQTCISQWKGLGWSSIIYIAAIAGIDSSLYEAAYVDGAGKLRSAIHITIPGLMPTFLVLMLMSIANFVNSGLDQYYVFQNSVVTKKIEVLELYTYRMGLQNNDYSYATTVGILKSIISLVMLFSANAVAKKVRGESIV